MSTSVWPHRWQPTRLLCPWDSPDKNTGVGCQFLLKCMHACYVASVVSNSVRPYVQQPTRLLHPQDSLGLNIGVGCHFLLQQDRHNEQQSLRNVGFASLDFNFQNLYNSLFLSEWNLLSLVWLYVTPWT